jgi:histidyl-tRNA synthetase
MDEGCMGLYQSLAGRFREKGIPCDVLSEPKKPGPQFAMAEKRGLSYLILADREAFGKDSYTIRVLKARDNKEGLGFGEIVEMLGKR